MVTLTPLFCSLSARWSYRSVKPADGSIRSCEGMCAGSHRVCFPSPSFHALRSSAGILVFSQRISGNGSATCFGDADITYPVASGNPLPVDERCVARWPNRGFSSSIELFRSWLTGHQAGDPLNSNTSSRLDSPASLYMSRSHHHRSYAPYPTPSTYASNLVR